MKEIKLLNRYEYTSCPTCLEKNFTQFQVRQKYRAGWFFMGWKRCGGTRCLKAKEIKGQTVKNWGPHGN